jgi:molecular chaperone DnaJ
MFRMKGLGVTKANGYGKGDELVYLNLIVPATLTERQKSLIEELSKEFENDAGASNRGFKEKVKQFFDL